MKTPVIFVLFTLIYYPITAFAEEIEQKIQTIESDLLDNIPTSCGCVAFRLDDVQDFFTREAQMDIIRLFNEENVTLTIGVVGGSLGQDLELVRFLLRNTTNMEIANHGWIHEDHTTMTVEEQRDSIERTNQKIVDLFGLHVKTFIPPENPFNEDTLTVMRETNLTHLSGSIFTDPDEPPFPLKNGDMIFHFPQTAFVSNVNPRYGNWTIFPEEQILESIDDSLSRYGFAVVVMHPIAHYEADNATYDKQSVESLRSMIKKLKEEFNFVKISDIDKQAWIPQHAILNAGLVNQTIYWKDESVRIFTTNGIQVSGVNDTIALEKSDPWNESFLMLLPSKIITNDITVLVENKVIPSMSLFSPTHQTWVLYVDPPRNGEILHIIPEFPFTSLLVAVVGVAFSLLIGRHKL